MASAVERTQVGIVTWAARVRRARAIEVWLADTLGAGVALAGGAGPRVELVRLARRHAFRAELWDALDPVLHDVDRVGTPAAPELEGLPGGSGAGADLAAEVRRALADVAPALGSVYHDWSRQAGPVADRPVARVLELVLRDEVDDRAGADAVLRTIGS